MYAKQGNKSHTGWKTKIKLFLFSDDLILFIGNHKKAPEKILVSEFSKMAMDKANTKIQLHFCMQSINNWTEI